MKPEEYASRLPQGLTSLLTAMCRAIHFFCKGDSYSDPAQKRDQLHLTKRVAAEDQQCQSLKLALTGIRPITANLSSHRESAFQSGWSPHTHGLGTFYGQVAAGLSALGLLHHRIGKWRTFTRTPLKGQRSESFVLTRALTVECSFRSSCLPSDKSL
jgi:hypothetical protein